MLRIRSSIAVAAALLIMGVHLFQPLISTTGWFTIQCGTSGCVTYNSQVGEADGARAIYRRDPG
ncbi:MAG: hypothetical protein JNM70_23530 [Anaerolineae bacterium]|nr:hypothetical protein [Anaerolineae bacterium]